jgi:hypothetical protein
MKEHIDGNLNQRLPLEQMILAECQYLGQNYEIYRFGFNSGSDGPLI